MTINSALLESLECSESASVEFSDTVWGQGWLPDKAMFVLRVVGVEMLTTRECVLGKGEDCL